MSKWFVFSALQNLWSINIKKFYQRKWNEFQSTAFCWSKDFLMDSREKVFLFFFFVFSRIPEKNFSISLTYSSGLENSIWQTNDLLADLSWFPSRLPSFFTIFFSTSKNSSNYKRTNYSINSQLAKTFLLICFIEFFISQFVASFFFLFSCINKVEMFGENLGKVFRFFFFVTWDLVYWW